MDLRLSSPITDVPRIGPAKAKILSKLGIYYVRDLLYFFPRRYEDFSQVTPIKDLQLGKQMTAKGKVISAKSSWGFQGKRRLLRIFVEIADETGTLSITWYNLRFLLPQLPVGREIYVAGQVELYKGKSEYSEAMFAMRSPAMEFPDKDPATGRTHTAAITPIYSETKGVTSRFLRYQIKQLLPLLGLLPEYMPTEIIERHKLMDIHEALATIHFPENRAKQDEAERRLRFDELFFLQLAALVRRRLHQQQNASPFAVTPAITKKAQAIIPFALTKAQKRSFKEIVSDLKKPQPMNRLLQGDVGSGKSAVALMATKVALDLDYKTLYLAPTEILARQQAESFSKSLGGKKTVHLLVGATAAHEKESVKKKLLGKEPIVVIGTHAILQDDVKAVGVGLVIIDEQHRFGVAQRHALRNIQKDLRPHLLSMTATPIPRTLNLTVYGDLDVSILDELPTGRKSIKTKIIGPTKKEAAIIHVLEELHKGRQGFVIAPLIEDSPKIEVKSAQAAYEEMKHLFPGVAVGLLHGQMSSGEKEATMRNFAAGAIQLLVSTAVVEVGVNVPNATIMIIEGAERFGLAQLHQFRGRVGRSEYRSYCYLFPTAESGLKNERLHVLERTTDGFKIAEEDLRLRGPGEIYGLAQSGFDDLKVASLLDYPTIKAAREEAEKILEQDPELQQHRIFRGKVEQKNQLTHFE